MRHACVTAVGGKLGLGKAFVLDRTGGFAAGAHDLGAFARLGFAQFFDSQRRCFDMEVDAVEERAADFGAVALDLRHGATALARPVSGVATGAGVHRTD